MKKSKLGKSATKAEMQFMMNGEMAVSQDEIESSLVFQNLVEQKMPTEIARIHGLNDVMTARAIKGWASYAVYSIEARFAQARIEAYKLFRRLRGDAESVIEAAVISQQSQGLLPIAPQVPALPPVDPGITYTVASSAQPGGAGIDMATLLAVGLDADGHAVVGIPTPWASGSSPGSSDPIGISTIVSGSSVVVAYPGLLVSGFSGLVPGQSYYAGWDGKPATFAAVIALAKGPIWMRRIGRALTASIMLVTDGLPEAINPPLILTT